MNDTPESRPATREALLASAAVLDADHARVAAALEVFLKVVESANRQAAGDMSTYRLRSDLASAPPDLFATVVDNVGRALSSTDVPLKLDVSELREEYFPTGYRRDKGRPFSCVELCTRLLDLYLDRAGEIEKQQAATDFVKAFGLHGNPVPKVVAGRAVICHGASLEGWSDHKRYSNSTQGHIAKVLATLARAIEMAIPSFEAASGELPSDALAAMRSDNWVADRTARVRVMGVEMRRYQERVDYHVPLNMASALNLFVGQYAVAPKGW